MKEEGGRKASRMGANGIRRDMQTEHERCNIDRGWKDLKSDTSSHAGVGGKSLEIDLYQMGRRYGGTEYGIWDRGTGVKEGIAQESCMGMPKPVNVESLSAADMMPRQPGISRMLNKAYGIWKYMFHPW